VPIRGKAKAVDIMAYDFVCIGSASIDHFAETDSELIKIQTRTTTEELIAYPLGSKLLINKLNITTGGGGTNSAVALSRLGLNTAFLGKVGEDSNGDVIIQSLEAEGVDFIGGREGQTGISIILDSISEDRSILAFKGANNFLKLSDVIPFESKWVYLASMLGESLGTVLDVVKARDCKLAFNPSNYQVELGDGQLLELISYVDLLIMNREEACKLLGVSCEENHDPQELMKSLEKFKPDMFVITDGSRGVYVSDRRNFYHGVPLEGITVVETTGAGDALAATFVAALSMGETYEYAIDMAMTNAESVIQRKGSKENLLYCKDIKKKIEQQQRHIAKAVLA